MATTNYLWDRLEHNVIGEFDDTGSSVASYVTKPNLFGDVMSQRRADSGARYYHKDALGTVTELTDQGGNVTDTFRATAFGETAESTGSTLSPFKYVGSSGYYADSGLDSLMIRRRRYLPNTARWLSVDPLSQRISPESRSRSTRKVWRFKGHLDLSRLHPPLVACRQPVSRAMTMSGVSAFAYGFNAPTSYIDPSGMVAFGCTCACRSAGIAYGEGLSSDAVDYTYEVIDSVDESTAEASCARGCESRGTSLMPCYGYLGPPPLGDPYRICDYVARVSACRGCSRAECRKVLKAIRAAIDNTDAPILDWKYFKQVGSLDHCGRWVRNFEAKLRAAVLKSPCVTSFREVHYRWLLVAGHVVVRIVFCNGITMYIDNGWAYGGPDSWTLEDTTLGTWTIGFPQEQYEQTDVR